MKRVHTAMKDAITAFNRGNRRDLIVTPGRAKQLDNQKDYLPFPENGCTLTPDIRNKSADDMYLQPMHFPRGEAQNGLTYSGL